MTNGALKIGNSTWAAIREPQEIKKCGNLSDTILIDISAFCRNPFLTGIQRQLEALLRYRGSRHLLPFLVEDRTTIRVLPRGFFDLVETFLKSGQDELAEARVAYHGSHQGKNSYYLIIRHYGRRFGNVCDPDSLLREVYAVLNTEYILDENYLDFYSGLLPKFGYKCFFIEHDLVFWTLRHHFAKMNEHVGHVKHLQLMRRATNVACVAETVVEDLRSIARRDDTLPIKIISPGGDSLGTAKPGPAPQTCRVAVVGTIEPRKCSALVLDVLEQLNERLGVEATFCGMISGLCPEALAKRFQALREPFLPIRVLSSLTDAEIRDVVLSSTVTVYLSDGEGFGVPPLESLALGVPVIVTADVPSLRRIPSNGQVRLAQNTVQHLTAALVRFADHEYAHTMRKEAAKISVPTWREYANAIFGWIDRTHDANRVTNLAQRLPAREANVLADKFKSYLTVPSPGHNGKRSSESEESSQFGLIGFGAPIGIHEIPNESEPQYQSRIFCDILAELYKVMSIYQSGQDRNFNSRWSKSLLLRQGLPEELANWRRTWPNRRDAFTALVAFYDSEESRGKHPDRPTGASEVLHKVKRVMTLLEDQMSNEDLITEAYLAIFSTPPDAKSFEEHLRNLEGGAPDARHHLLRSLLTSDPALERWTDDAEAWSFLAAALGIDTPYWQLGRATYERTKSAAIAVDGSLAFSAAASLREQLRQRMQTAKLAQLGNLLLAGKPVEWLPFLELGSVAQRVEGVVRGGGQSGHMVFGPYFKLPAGRYSARAIVDCGDRGVSPARKLGVFEAMARDPETFLVQQDLVFSGKQEHTISFEVPKPRAVEIRVWTNGETPLTISSVKVQRIAGPQKPAQ